MYLQSNTSLCDRFQCHVCVTADDRDSELLSSYTLRSELQGKYHSPVKKKKFSAQDSSS